MLQYCSEQHKQLVETTVNELPKFYVEKIKRLNNINNNEVFIWHICNQWMQSTGKNQEAQKEAHLEQLRYLEFACGMVSNNLTDQEWDEWTDYLLDLLEHLRTFNGSFLGLLWKRGQITGEAADIYNLLMWHYAIYYFAAKRAYEILRPRVIEYPSSDAYIGSNQNLSTLHLNLDDFCRRFALNKSHIDFIRRGFEICRNAPKGTPWSAYYDSLNSPH